jgi:hypothetical protein
MGSQNVGEMALEAARRAQAAAQAASTSAQTGVPQSPSTGIATPKPTSAYNAPPSYPSTTKPATSSASGAMTAYSTPGTASVPAGPTPGPGPAPAPSAPRTEKSYLVWWIVGGVALAGVAGVSTWALLRRRRTAPRREAYAY